MTFSTTLVGCALGLCLGARHALEPDHLAAVSTLVADGRRPRVAALLGTCWGLGHTVALAAVGALVLLLRTELSEEITTYAELVVAAMLLLLGGRNILAAVRGSEHAHVYDHGRRHARWTLARRPLAVGLVHGLAGSGALTPLAVAGMPTHGTALLFVAVFGVGSVVGMGLVSAIAGFSIERWLGGARSRRVVRGATGMLSVAVGIAWTIPCVEQLAAA